MSQHMSTCRGMRWQMDWRWKACAPAHWGPNRSQQLSSGSESTVGLRGGSGSESEDTKAVWSSLGMVPMDSDELTGEASGEPTPHETESCKSCSSGSEETGAGYVQV